MVKVRNNIEKKQMTTKIFMHFYQPKHIKTIWITSSSVSSVFNNLYLSDIFIHQFYNHQYTNFMLFFSPRNQNRTDFGIWNQQLRLCSERPVQSANNFFYGRKSFIWISLSLMALHVACTQLWNQYTQTYLKLQLKYWYYSAANTYV